MLKLVIADDERVIRETISRMIVWEQLGVELIGLCRDGIELYNMILDESPDIVMTDIRMPGLSGLEVVREIASANRQIQFIFLSGYEEFDYAREAMKYGVKYYLLKPCNEKKMEEAILQAREDCLRIKRQNEALLRQNSMLRTIRQEAMYHLFMAGIAWKEKETLGRRVKELLEIYGQYLEFQESPCYLYLVYYLEWGKLEEMLAGLEANEKKNRNSGIFYGAYVKNTLLLLSYEGQQEEVLKACADGCSSLTEIASERYENLTELLEKVLLRVRRYDMVYVIHDYQALGILNAQGPLAYMQDIFEQIGSSEGMEGIEELFMIAKEASGPDVLQMLCNGLCARMMAIGMLTMVEVTELLCQVNRENQTERLRELAVEIIGQVKEKLDTQSRSYGIVVEKVMAYVKEHLSECDLTLKKISEEYLYMNVDYVSRIFRKSTGSKFSQYLTEQRVKRAKELLLEDDTQKIQYVAEKVGCGNNPQYFSQIFKKAEGMTPGKWAAQMKKIE